MAKAQAAAAEAVSEASEKSADPPILTDEEATGMGGVHVIPPSTSRLHFGRIKPASGARNHWFASIPPRATLEDVLVPAYWAHYTREQIRPMDVIEAFCEDGTWEALLRVMFVGQVEVRLSVIYQVEHEKADVDIDTDTHEVKWISPARKYGVVRKDTGEVIQDDFYPKSRAVEFLRRHLTKLKT